MSSYTVYHHIPYIKKRYEQNIISWHTVNTPNKYTVDVNEPRKKHCRISTRQLMIALKGFEEQVLVDVFL